MDYNTILNEFSSKPPQEQHKLMMDFLGNMPYDRYAQFKANEENTMREHARRNEREDIICRLIAAGMSVDDIALTLVEPIAAVQDIAERCRDRRIRDYTRTFKQRQKRKQQQQGG